jgi:phosphatidate phosphatase APP1
MIDIDDTIKISEVCNRKKLLRRIFIEKEARPVDRMPQLYNSLIITLSNPTIFYVSASPAKLRPFIKRFIQKHYPPGQIILRDSSYLELIRFLVTLSPVGAQKYKEDEMDKIHGMFPKKQFYCIGDSTHTDPEAYGIM